MKKLLLVVAAAVIGLAVGAATVAANDAGFAPATSQSVASTDSDTSDTVQKTEGLRPFGKMDGTSTTPSGVYVLRIIPILTHSMADPRWPAEAKQAIDDAGMGIIGLPTNRLYRAGNYVDWEQLTLASSNTWAQYGGDGRIVQQVIVATDGSGQDRLPMSMLSVRSESTAENILGDALTLRNLNYSPLAIGQTVSGRQITSGSSTQMCQKVIFLTQMKMFSADNAHGIVQVGNWVGARKPFNVRYTAQIIGLDSTRASTTVTVGGILPPPSIAIRRAPDWTVDITVTGEYWLYSIWSAPRSTGPWQNMGPRYSGQPLNLPAGAWYQFFMATY